MVFYKEVVIQLYKYRPFLVSKKYMLTKQLNYEIIYIQSRKLNKEIAMKFKVYFWEYERRWGSRLDFISEYDTYEEAAKVINEFNSENTDDPVPDWYMVARGPYEIK